jgi:hypothetical protein
MWTKSFLRGYAKTPDSLIALRKEAQRRLPRAELPQILLEIAPRTEFSNEFTHISERDSRASEPSEIG